MTSDFIDETGGDDLADGPGLRASLEAILLVADEPVPEDVLTKVKALPHVVRANRLRF